MIQSSLFSSGLELASVVAASDLLTSSWDAISRLGRENRVPNEDPFSSLAVTVEFKAYRGSKYEVIAFVPSSACTKNQLQADGDLAPLSTLEQIRPHFDFLCTKSNPSFSIHKAAAALFASLHSQLSGLKAKILADKSGLVVITGHSLGGSIASLFTLWLLEDINLSARKRPICITFGSPLVGDNGLRQAIMEHSTWNSCFLHVAAFCQDPIPKLFASDRSGHYKPFGTYLLCSESGSACFEEAESILEMVMAADLESKLSRASLNCDERFPNNVNYGQIVENLKSMVAYKGISLLGGERITDPLRGGIALQLETVGIKRTQQHNIDVAALVKRAGDDFKRKKRAIDPVKKLNEIKIHMAKLEWYKMDSKAKGIGYYDTYKSMLLRQDVEVKKDKTILTNYWKEEVAKAEKTPQKEGAFLRTGWLGGGTSYRRMVEPLEIADYYRVTDAKDYLTKGRRRHFALLEKWQMEHRARGKSTKAAAPAKEPRTAAGLTEDSCFWARVEEAIILCNLLSSPESSPAEKESSRSSLIEFEHYVMGLIKSHAVSPEVFLGQSSFMLWWGEYEKAMETDHSKPLTVYMRNRGYEKICLEDDQ